jgi:hypothetical protein
MNGFHDRLVWSNIKDSVTLAIHDIREQRLQKLRTQTLDDRLHQMKKVVKEYTSFRQYSALADFEAAVIFPRVSEFIDPDLATFDLQGLKDYLAVEIPSYMEKRESDARNITANALREKFKLSASCDPFSLAIGAMVHCSKCDGTHSIDSILRHIHNWPLRDLFQHTDRKFNQEYMSRVENLFFYSCAWNIKTISLLFERQAAVIEACGLDVKTATEDDMDRADARLLCTNHNGYRPVMTWRNAVCYLLVPVPAD